jgi:hypothetical protein
MRSGPNRERREAPEEARTKDPDALIPQENTMNKRSKIAYV